MPIDPRIALGVQPFQIQDPTNQLAKMLQMQGAQQTNALNGLKMDEYQRARAEENKLSALTRESGGDMTKLRDLLMGAGNYKQGMALNKTLADQRQAEALAKKTQLETDLTKLDMGGRILGGVTDEASYQHARAVAKATGFGELPPQYDPAFVKLTVDQGIDRKTQLEQQWKAMEYTTPKADARLTDERTRAEGALNRGVTLRGQSLTDARGREANNLKKLELQGGGKPPSGYRANPDGSLSFIPGGPADPARNGEKMPTEGERKAATLLQRLEGSSNQLDQALRENPSAAKPELMAQGLRSVGMEAAANTTLNAKRQRVEAAQLDILDAALTLGTGAAYTKEQLLGYRQSYFPQIGDTKEQVADKKARLENVINAAKIAAGRAGAQVSPTQATPRSKNAAAPASNIDALLDKYK
jgi:hypothetical protein